MTTIIPARSAAEFLALVPRMLAFTPTRSVVFVPFDGTRSCGAMRIDLPSPALDDDIDSVAATYLGMICRISAADSFTAVIYTDEAIDPKQARLPQHKLIMAILQRADSCGLTVHDALCVAADAWGSYLDARRPRERRSLAEIASSTTTVAPAPAAGDQTTGAALPEVSQAEREQVEREYVELNAAAATVCGFTPHARESIRINPAALTAVGALDDIPLLFEQALKWDAAHLAPFQTASLLWCLSRPSLRDIGLAGWCLGLSRGDAAAEGQLRWEGGEEYPEDIAQFVWGDGPKPDSERLERALVLTRRVAAAARTSRQPGPLAICAWLSWALGRSTHAGIYASRACEIDPHHGFAKIMISMVAASHLPQWAFAHED
ncbi:hypothetical protein FHX49_002484 [Microbacterium endophyticum]|uniref:DUF4192 family protein n=1 Tax=Microbacterium endophyticum TaxID=1526412 RepID=A0A7W4V4W1_9MICO|nr:DUF4192 family protein [Microbacterium endophyticum]MBB2976896.1 hypothetical protein [Microbacterium endophyticum]NIK35786.1 hypothetical protein [Microbacterium endophyticum]